MIIGFKCNVFRSPNKVTSPMICHLIMKTRTRTTPKILRTTLTITRGRRHQCSRISATTELVWLVSRSPVLRSRHLVWVGTGSPPSSRSRSWVTHGRRTSSTVCRVTTTSTEWETRSRSQVKKYFQKKMDNQPILSANQKHLQKFKNRDPLLISRKKKLWNKLL